MEWQVYIKQDSLDDLLHEVYSKLLKRRLKIAATKGDFKEITGVLLHLKKPRARISRAEGKGKLFSCLGELLWYLAGSKQLKFIEYYIPLYKKSSDDYRTIYGGYGPRLCGKGKNAQLSNIINLLKDRSTTRQAVIQLFDSKDILKRHKDIPCTCTLQFLIRKNKLHMFTSMRSNDAFLGLPHDIFAFSMLQEIIAMSCGCEIGEYKHYVGSLHLYEKNFEAAAKYLDSGIQTIVEMPEMPKGDPMPSIKILLDAENKIRQGMEINPLSLNIDDYWKDLINILQFFRHTKFPEEAHKAEESIKKVKSPVYSTYLEKRKQEKVPLNDSRPEQFDIFYTESIECNVQL
ncbi:MAG: thymidylate synthase [Pseudomonas sp.]|jgi:thymidylate synthase